MLTRSFWLLVILVITASAGFVVALEVAEDKKPSKAAKKKFLQIERLIKSGKIDRAIEAIRLFEQQHADDPLAEKTEPLLRRCGVGDEGRVVLRERAFFKKIKLLEEPVLSRAEDSLEKLLPFYGELSPLYEKRSITFQLYDSEGRYRQHSDIKNSSGHFRPESMKPSKRTFSGKVEWFFRPGPAKDRITELERVLFHECGHYLNYAYFAGFLPALFEEGIATFFETRKSEGKYTFNQQTIRQQRESEARNSLRTIEPFTGFVEFLDSRRGLGRGDSSINRWYALCYAVVDFFERGELNGRQSSQKQLFGFLSRKCEEQWNARYRKGSKRSSAQALRGHDLLRDAVRELYDAELAQFHDALLKFVIANYRQR